MKKIIFIVFVLVMCNFTFAQSPLVELNKVKEIKLLKSNRDDVRKILADYNFDSSYDSEHYQWISTSKARIRILYSRGKCSEDSEEWNVPEWKVTQIEISPKSSIQIKDIGFGHSKFRKERLYANEPSSFVYHKKEVGFAFEVLKSVVKKIYLFPSIQDYSLLCDNESTRKFYSSKKWFTDSKLKERYIDYNFFADVIDLILGESEIYETCFSSNPSKNESCQNGVNTITVSTIAKDPENDVLTYDYKISGGKITGQGSKVIWDLSDVKAGIYTITAGVDDGCGICGKTITKTVSVKECVNCSVK